MKKMDNRAIGFMDSGVGGLTVVREALRQLPLETVYFIGDQARLPYGPRSSAEVQQFSEQMAAFLMKKNIKMLVIACNTATAAALDDLKEKLPIPVIGVISPGSRAALKVTKNRRIGVIGTEGTVKSHAYEQAILAKDNSVKVFSLACPKFVSLVESNAYKSSVAKKVVAETLQYFENKNVDTLVLGCTHYPLLRPIIQDVMGDEVRLIDSGAETIGTVSALLDYFDIAKDANGDQQTNAYYTTASPASFNQIASQWLKFEVQAQKTQIKQLKLEVSDNG
ncbi:glutamate racemase [Pediococcus siamensis]|uniref:glutamate racemase n=1 Tax=Pediococcus siamensis TaxID=381829 RepID=UPI0039A0435A